MKTIFALLAAFIVAGNVHAATPFEHKSAQLACKGRTVKLEAQCFPAMGKMLVCNKQSLTFAGADGKKIDARVFTPDPANDAFDYPAIEEKFGALSCVEMTPNESYVVARMYNGGSCQSCEWFDVYTPDGKLVGTNRDRKVRNKVVDAAVDAAYDEKAKRVIGKNELDGFYVKGEKR